MKRIAALIVAGFLAIGLVGKPAAAATYNLGAIPANGGAFHFGGAIALGQPTFTDTFNFTLTAPHSDLSGVVADILLQIGKLPILDITKFGVALLDSTNTLIGSILLDGPSPNSTGLSFAYSNLASGAYHLVVGGQTAGLFGGVYILAFDTEVSQVPIPAALPLFLTAVAGMGGFAYRRRQSAAGVA